MSGFGRQLTGKAGIPIQVSADGAPRWKVAGITIDWDTVDPVVSDTTLPDGNVILAGEKGIRFGTVLAKITTGGKYGPYDSGAGDGREALSRGDCFILNQTVREHPVQRLGAVASDHPAVFDGGIVFKARLVLDAGTAPSTADFESAFPSVTYAGA